MQKPVNNEGGMLSAAECARRTGLTVRALRVYEQHKLLKPARTAKGWRVYGAEELKRLNVIVTLKSAGLTLANIRKVLASGPQSLERALEAQVQTWQAAEAGAKRGLRHAGNALEALRTHRTLPLDQLCQLIRSFQMSEMPKVMKEIIEKNFTPEEMEAFRKRKLAMGDLADIQQRWDEVIAEAKRLLAAKADPASPAAQAMARRWKALVDMFTQQDPDIARKTGSVWQEAFKRDPEGKGLPFTKDVWEYAGKCIKAMT